MHLQSYALIGLVVILIILMVLFIKLTSKLQQTQRAIIEIKDDISQEKQQFHLELQAKSDYIHKLREDLMQQEAVFAKQMAENIKLAKKQSNDQQRSVIKGQIGENFAPFMQGFDYSPSDCQFLGQPIDFLIFHNLHKCADNEVDIDEVSIILAEIKTGKSRLNKRQQIVKEAIKRGNVSFESFRIDDNYPPTIDYEEKHSSVMNSVTAYMQSYK